MEKAEKVSRTAPAIRAVRYTEYFWAIAAAVGVVMLGTLNGILVAVALSVLVLFYQANRPPVYVVGRKRGTNVFEPASPDDEMAVAGSGDSALNSGLHQCGRCRT